MTDHRTTAETLIDAADPTSPHTRDRTLTDAALVRAVLAVADAIDAHGTREHVIDHAALQQNLDRARAAFPGTDQRLCMAEGRTPRGNRVVCSQPRDNHTRHSAGGYWWDDDEDEGSSVCPADGCGRPDGHDGDHRAGEPLTLPTMTAKRGGLRYRGQTIETQGSTLHATPFVALHTNEGGDTSALATDVPDGSHEHGSAPAPDRLPPIVRSARTCADLTTNRRFAEVFTTCADVIEGMHRDATGQRVLMDSYERQIRALAQQNGQLRDQRDRESEARLAAQQAAVDPDLHQKLRRIDNVLRGALNAERTPSTLSFIDLVTDLGLRADAVVDDLTSERESRATVFETAKTLSKAIVHTVDYVGNDMLPAVEGWSWYDALREFDPDAANRFVTNPVRPKAGQ
ncbi:hypothetical protein SEA_BARSTEN_59 [Gordonia Phage Barsten]|uniref:Uncharacterized protein n=1 Tax=Gordonia Phage Barsten TaxID=2743907 RepID=A0A7G3VBF8_9CAUD|nr:hypothetical protein KNV14_gp59 [Gordonia Phage Barsten]QKY78414.1 hypothetical protein SEA_BARSTEN_59 [Gordonia Phage Barsten]